MAAPDPVPGVFPSERLHLLAGSNYSGKSTLLAQLCNSLIQGTPFLDLPVTRLSPKQICLVFCDRAMNDNAEWINKLDVPPMFFAMADDEDYIARLKRDAFISSPSTGKGGVVVGKRNTLSGYAQFEWLVNRLDPAPGTFLLIDVFSNVFVGSDIQHNIEVRANMLAISHLARKRGLTVLGTCYGVKIQGDKNSRYARLIDRIIGGASFRGSASTLAYISSPEETQLEPIPQTIKNPADLQILQIVPRQGAERRYFIQRTQPTGFFAQAEHVTVEELVDEVTPRRTCKSALLDLLAATDTKEGLTLETCRNVLGASYSDESIRSTLHRLVKAGHATWVREGVYAPTPAPAKK